MENSRKILTAVTCLLLLFTSVFTFSCNPKTTTTTSSSTGTQSTAPVVVDEWYLPLLVPLTGPSVVNGLKAEWSAKYAAKVVSDAGGARGVPINVIAYDSPGDPAKVVTAVAEIIGQKPLCMLGPIDGISMGVVINMIAKEGIPLNGFFSTKVEQMQYAPLGTHMMPDDVKAAGIGAKEWIKLHPEIKSVAVFYYTGLTEEPAKGAQQGFIEAGVTVYMIDIYFGKDIDMGPVVTRAMSLNVDGYYSAWYGMDFVSMLKALSDRGMTEGWRIMAGGQAMGAEVFTLGKNYNEGIYFWELFDLVNPGNAEFQNYVTAYEADHDGGFPYTWANWGFYYAVKAFAAAVEKENITGDPAKLAEERAAIRDYFWNATSTPGFGSDTFNYSDQGHVVAPLYIYQVEDNQLTIPTVVE